ISKQRLRQEALSSTTRTLLLMGGLLKPLLLPQYTASILPPRAEAEGQKRFSPSRQVALGGFGRDPSGGLSSVSAAPTPHKKGTAFAIPFSPATFVQGPNNRLKRQHRRTRCQRPPA